jgi:hypothetical protein
MAILLEGIYGPVTGKVGNKVYSYRNGVQCVREIKPRTEKSTGPTLAQLETREKFAMITKCLSTMRDILDLGFTPVTPQQKWKGTFGLAVSLNYKHVFKGTYPNLWIEYSALRICHGYVERGNLMSIAPEAGGIRFTWDCGPCETLKGLFNDRILMVAYFPSLERTIYLKGANRETCTDFLNFEPKFRKKHMEVYAAFLSADGKYSSHSMHLGTLNLKRK